MVPVELNRKRFRIPMRVENHVIRNHRRCRYFATAIRRGVPVSTSVTSLCRRRKRAYRATIRNGTLPLSDSTALRIKRHSPNLLRHHGIWVGAWRRIIIVLIPMRVERYVSRDWRCIRHLVAGILIGEPAEEIIAVLRCRRKRAYLAPVRNGSRRINLGDSTILRIERYSPNLLRHHGIRVGAWRRLVRKRFPLNAINPASAAAVVEITPNIVAVHEHPCERNAACYIVSIYNAQPFGLAAQICDIGQLRKQTVCNNAKAEGVAVIFFYQPSRIFKFLGGALPRE